MNVWMKAIFVFWAVSFVIQKLIIASCTDEWRYNYYYSKNRIPKRLVILGLLSIMSLLMVIPFAIFFIMNF